MRLSKDEAKRLFRIGIDNYGFHGREAYMLEYPYKDHPTFGAHSLQCYMAGVKANEFGHNRDEELRKIL